jgi:hypothetical protein
MAAFFRAPRSRPDKSIADSPPILRMPRAGTRASRRFRCIEAARKAYDARVAAASRLRCLAAAQGPADVPRIGEERLEFRLLSDAADPTLLRNVVSPETTFAFTGGKPPQAVASPLGPAVRLATGVAADLGSLGDVEYDEPFSCGAWVQVTTRSTARSSPAWTSRTPTAAGTSP